MNIPDIVISETSRKYLENNNIELGPDVKFILIYNCNELCVVEKQDLFSKFSEEELQTIISVRNLDGDWEKKTIGEVIKEFNHEFEEADVTNLGDGFIYALYGYDEKGEPEIQPTQLSCNLEDLIDEIKYYNSGDMIIYKEYLLNGDGKHRYNDTPGDYMIFDRNGTMKHWWSDKIVLYHNTDLDTENMMTPNINQPLEDFDIVSDRSFSKFGIVRKNITEAEEIYSGFQGKHIETVEWYYEDLRHFYYYEAVPNYYLNKIDLEFVDSYKVQVPDAVKYISGIVNHGMPLALIHEIS